MVVGARVGYSHALVLGGRKLREGEGIMDWFIHSFISLTNEQRKIPDSRPHHQQQQQQQHKSAHPYVTLEIILSANCRAFSVRASTLCPASSALLIAPLIITRVSKISLSISGKIPCLKNG